VGYTHLLFDHDGVLVNTEPLYLRAIQEQLATLDIALAEADYIQKNGRWRRPLDTGSASGL